MRVNQIIEISRLLQPRSTMLIMSFIENYADYNEPIDGAIDGIALFCRYYDVDDTTQTELREVIRSK